MIKELFEHVKHFGKTIMPKFDETLVKKVPVKATFNKGLKPKTMYKNQRRIFNKYFIKKDTKRLLISEPPGAGKSMTIMFIEAYKLLNIPGHKGIIVVPQNLGSKSFGKDTIKFDDGTIFHWNIYNDLCNTSDSQKVDKIIDFLYRRKFTNNPNERVLITTHTAMAIAFKRICHLNNLNELFDNTSFFIDEAHHIMYAKCSENFITNQIGALVQAINGNQNCFICLTTATPFRGDRNSIIPKEQMKTFDVHFLPLDKHWEENLQYIKSFTFDFVIYKMDGLFEGIKNIIKNKKKTIIFCPYQGELVRKSDKIKFRDKLISSILSVWPECKIMDLIEESGRDPIKKELLDNKTARAFDVILTLKMFDESTDWVCAQQCIDLCPSNTLRIMYQRFGRLWRDFLGKTLIEYYCFLPFEADFKDEEQRREHLSNSYNVFIATLLLQETVDPIPYPVKPSPPINREPIKFEVDGEFDEEIQLNPFDKSTDDEKEREDILHAIVNKLLVMASHDSNPNLQEAYGWIESVVDEYEIIEGKDEVITHIAKILRRTLNFNKKPDWFEDSIDISWMRNAGFDEIWSNDILSGLLVFGTKVCGIKHFEEFRKTYGKYKHVDEYVKHLEQIEKENNGIVPKGTINKLGSSSYGYIVNTYPEKFAHINFETSITDTRVKHLEQIEKKNDGVIPYGTLENLGGAYRLAICQYPKKFAHLNFEKRTPDKHIRHLEQIETKNDGYVPYKILITLENACRVMIRDYPERFAHINIEKDIYEEYVKHLEQIEKENGGHVPFGTIAKLGTKYEMAIHKYPERFAHINIDKNIYSRCIKHLEQIEKENGGHVPFGTIAKLGTKYEHAISRHKEKFAHLLFETREESKQRRLKDVA